MVSIAVHPLSFENNFPSYNNDFILLSIVLDNLERKVVAGHELYKNEIRTMYLYMAEWMGSHG